MVRFKNRWFLVEILYPSSQPVPLSSHSSANASASTNPSSTSSSSINKRPKPSDPSTSSNKKSKPSSRLNPPTRPAGLDSDDSEDGEDDHDEGEDGLEWSSGTLGGPMPLLLPPSPNPTTGKSKRLDERSIHQALKASVVQVFGDDGWGKVGSNTTVKYYSPHTSLCIIRTSRDHHRTVWAALSMIGSVNGERVLARVVHCSGTIRKIQLATITYNRLLVSAILDSADPPYSTSSSSSTVSKTSAPSAKKSKGDGDEGKVKLAVPEGEGGWSGWAEREKSTIEAMTD